MAVQFDNLDDIQSKFANTICLHEGKPVFINHAGMDPEFGKEYALNLKDKSGKNKYILLSDPAFSYRDFNLGYANCGVYSCWWYRRPSKQYQQGLKKHQMGWRNSHPGYHPDEQFGFTKAYWQMLEDVYPDLETCQKQLRDHSRMAIAFHKDFALTWDDVHDDMILECRGKKIGHSVNSKCTEYKLKPEFKHLQESLMEVLEYVQR
jgi:hypothetical protein